MGHEVKPSVSDVKKTGTNREKLKTYNKRKEMDVMTVQDMELSDQNQDEAAIQSPNRYPAGKLFFGDDIDAGSKAVDEPSKKSQQRYRKETAQASSRDIVNDLIRSSHNIWEEAAIGLIYEKYHTDVTLHHASLEHHGINNVVTKTMQMLHAFSSFRVINEGVISSKNHDNSLYVSQRSMSNGLNSSESIFGPATGQRVAFRSITEQIVYRQRIVEEWQIRDNLHIVKQLGLDPFDVAKMLADITCEQPGNCYSSPNSNNRQSQLLDASEMDNKFDVGDFVFELFSRVWNYHYLNEMENFYLPHAIIHTVCNKDLSGIQQMQSFLMSFFASVPNARITIERVTCETGGQYDDWNVSVRWKVTGLHEGIGFFGSPTGKPVKIIGSSHLHIQEGKIAEEWMLFDGMDVLRQLYMPDATSFNQI